MKKAIISSTVFILMFLLCVGITFAEAEKTEFTGQKGHIQVILCGAQWFDGDSELVHFRNRVLQQWIEVDSPGDDRVDGTLTVYINCDYKIVAPYDEGRFWGTFILEPTAYGAPFVIPVGSGIPCQEERNLWLGQVNGKIVPDGSWSGDFIGEGTGMFSGQKIHLKLHNTNLAYPGPPIPSRTWEMEGYILAP